MELESYDSVGKESFELWRGRQARRHRPPQLYINIGADANHPPTN